MTNKAERERKTKIKFKNRLKKHNLWKSFLNKTGDFYVFKSTGSPCSCAGCSGQKYSRKLKHNSSEIPEE